MSNAGLVVAHILVSVFLVPQEFETKSATVKHQEALVVGISTETSEQWIGFLLSEGIGFSVEQAGSNLMVSQGALPILEKAKEIPTLEQEAKRAIAERRIEMRIGDLWPQVTKPAVCIAVSNEDSSEMSIEETVVFVVAPNFPQEDQDQLVQIIDDVAGPVQTERVRILGSIPPGTSPDRTIAHRRSVSLAQR